MGKKYQPIYRYINILATAAIHQFHFNLHRGESYVYHRGQILRD